MGALDRVRGLRDVSRRVWTLTRFRLQSTVKDLQNKQERIKGRLLPIPAVQLIVRTIQKLGPDDASHLVAGVAYYALLSLFPLLLGLIALLGLFLPSEDV